MIKKNNQRINPINKSLYVICPKRIGIIVSMTLEDSEDKVQQQYK